MNKITKIVLTGGPCAGKSTAMSYIQEYFSNRGYDVFFISETATELILGGLTPASVGFFEFETAVTEQQISKETTYETSAKNSTKALIVCDRGIMDAKCYTTEEQFKSILDKFGLTETQARDGYDAVFHLVTAAKGAEEFYTKANNEARMETLEEAIDADTRTLNAWVGHPHLRVIGNKSDFESKMNEVIRQINLFLGEPEPFEIERKFLIEKPDVDLLESLGNSEKSEIVQTYLKSEDPDIELRVRQRGVNGSFIYTKTSKRMISDIKRIESERRITQREYIDELMNIDHEKHPIRKTRYCLMVENQYYEIDVYPGWNKYAIMEIELESEDSEIDIPNFINIVKDVTGDPKFKNSSLAIDCKEPIMKNNLPDNFYNPNYKPRQDWAKNIENNSVKLDIDNSKNFNSVKLNKN